MRPQTTTEIRRRAFANGKLHLWRYAEQQRQFYASRTAHMCAGLVTSETVHAKQFEESAATLLREIYEAGFQIITVQHRTCVITKLKTIHAKPLACPKNMRATINAEGIVVCIPKEQIELPL